MWALYCRPNKYDTKRAKIQTFEDEGEASAYLCAAAMHFPGLDWKLRKIAKQEVK